MAKRVKHTSVPEKPKGVAPDEFQRIIAEINRQKSLASEYNGAGGKLTRDAIANHSLDRKAFGVVTSLAKVDEQKRQATVRALFEYVEKAGFLDQLDAFNDVTDMLAAIVERARARIPNRENDGTVAAVLN